jgi:hypothetical protein
MTNNKQQTAVDSIIELCQEFLADRYSISHDGVCSEIIRFCQEQAKEMEKERIETAYNKGTVHGIDYPESTLPITGEQYYKQTYGGGEQ